MKINAFLTAFDPSDLPGGSIDPLGFERGYLFLADKILPGLTNAANCPRYFSVLSCGAHLAGDFFHESSRKQYRERLQLILRLERFWALANVLASMSQGHDDKALSGLRGVGYAKTRAEQVLGTGTKLIDSNFKLLSRQVQYGGIGMYGTVAEGLRFFERRTLSLTPDLGAKLASGFVKETKLPPRIIKAVEGDEGVDGQTLTEWGMRAHINGTTRKIEAECFNDALHLNPVRSRMTQILQRYPSYEEDTELKRLSRIHKGLKSEGDSQDLRDAINCILKYETAYRWAMLGLERMLWLCRSDASGSVLPKDLEKDVVFESVAQALPRAVRRFVRAVEKATTENLGLHAYPIHDTSQFLENAASSCENGGDLAQAVLDRHGEVQRGKFDKGRRKMPWVELTAGGRIALTTTRIGGLDSEAKEPKDISPHPYRLNSADALFKAGAPA